MTEAITAYVGIGSNIDGPAARVRSALDALDGLPRTKVTARSSLYLNPPMGPAEQPHYVNAVAALQTGLDPRRLLDLMLEIETAHGRVRQQHWGPRTLDLDLLTYDALATDDPELMLPHPGIAQRAFVLVPLAQIAPELEIPGLGLVIALRDALSPAERGTLFEIEE